MKRSMKGENNPAYKHGHAVRGRRPRQYAHFMNMKARCTQVSNKDYNRYGAVGITVCDRWRFGEHGLSGYECFLLDMGEQPAGTTIDRIDGTKGYSPDNCRWATPTQQANNRKSNHTLTIRGETKTIAQWARQSGIGPKTILHRLQHQGMSAEAAVFNPLSWTKRQTTNIGQNNERNNNDTSG